MLSSRSVRRQLREARAAAAAATAATIDTSDGGCPLYELMAVPDYCQVLTDALDTALLHRFRVSRSMRLWVDPLLATRGVMASDVLAGINAIVARRLCAVGGRTVRLARGEYDFTGGDAANAAHVRAPRPQRPVVLAGYQRGMDGSLDPAPTQAEWQEWLEWDGWTPAWRSERFGPLVVAAGVNLIAEVWMMLMLVLAPGAAHADGAAYAGRRGAARGAAVGAGQAAHREHGLPQHRPALRRRRRRARVLGGRGRGGHPGELSAGRGASRLLLLVLLVRLVLLVLQVLLVLVVLLVLLLTTPSSRCA